jgi:glycyl-tRNA synthetase alpha chain
MAQISASAPIAIRSAILSRLSRLPHPMAKKPAQPPRTFQDLILTLQQYWAGQGCALMQPYDMEMGAGTFHTATFLRAVGPEPWSAAYVQPSRRPTDGRYGENPFRVQALLPIPGGDKTLAAEPDRPLSGIACGAGYRHAGARRAAGRGQLGIADARGMGSRLGGVAEWHGSYPVHVFPAGWRPRLPPGDGEITYGLERLAMYLQGVESFFDLVWTDGPLGQITYRDVCHQNEVEQSRYNFELADVAELSRQFDATEQECQRLLEAGVPLPAYERMLTCSHTFNLLDARKAISVTERQRYILRVRTLARGVAEAYHASREALGFPMTA